MSPVALYSSTTTTTKARMTIPASTPGSVAVVGAGAGSNDIPRRPSPWHGLEHSLSTATITTSTSATPHEPGSGSGSRIGSGIASRRVSSPNLNQTSGPLAIDNETSRRDRAQPPSPTPILSTSQALRDWEERLKSPESDAKRHQLVHPPPTPVSYAHGYAHPHPHPHQYSTRSSPARSSPVLPPKLAAERDKEGHIEYKLKLIEPTPERFGKLVTQMMWRLKQGKNEAIYELGLADDGTVVGLTRAEMDASLKTLELMASELGATVMILREIVLSVHPPPILSDKCSSSNLSLSLSSSAYSSNDGTGIWPVRRPDLDDQGQPRRGTKILGGPVESVDVDLDVDVVEVEVEKETGRAWKKPVVRGQMGTARQVIFDPRDLDDGDRDKNSDSDDDGDRDGRSPPGMRASASRRATCPQRDRSHTDDDIPPFHLDLDDDLPIKPIIPTSPSRGSRRRRRKLSKPIEEPTLTRNDDNNHNNHNDDGPSVVKVNTKRTRAAQKREARRLDLLRGDGMDPNWASRGRAQLDGFFDLDPDPTDTSCSLLGADTNADLNSNSHSNSIQRGGVRLPHQPARPSSLRLSAAPAPPLVSDPTSRGTSHHPNTDSEEGRESKVEKEEDDESLWSLSHMPLDSLSLSFANVHIEDISPPSSPSLSSDTEYAYATSTHRQTINQDLSHGANYNKDTDAASANADFDDTSSMVGRPFTGQGYTGQERICVEALVVRKVQHGHGADGGGEEEEECGWGGEDDVWGLGVDDD